MSIFYPKVTHKSLVSSSKTLDEHFYLIPLSHATMSNLDEYARCQIKKRRYANELAYRPSDRLALSTPKPVDSRDDRAVGSPGNKSSTMYSESGSFQSLPLDGHTEVFIWLSGVLVFW